MYLSGGLPPFRNINIRTQKFKAFKILPFSDNAITANKKWFFTLLTTRHFHFSLKQPLYFSKNRSRKKTPQFIYLGVKFNLRLKHRQVRNTFLHKSLFKALTAKTSTTRRAIKARKRKNTWNLLFRKFAISRVGKLPRKNQLIFKRQPYRRELWANKIYRLCTGEIEWNKTHNIKDYPFIPFGLNAPLPKKPASKPYPWNRKRGFSYKRKIRPSKMKLKRFLDLKSIKYFKKYIKYGRPKKLDNLIHPNFDRTKRNLRRWIKTKRVWLFKSIKRYFKKQKRWRFKRVRTRRPDNRYPLSRKFSFKARRNIVIHRNRKKIKGRIIFLKRYYAKRTKSLRFKHFKNIKRNYYIKHTPKPRYKEQRRTLTVQMKRKKTFTSTTSRFAKTGIPLQKLFHAKTVSPKPVKYSGTQIKKFMATLFPFWAPWFQNRFRIKRRQRPPYFNRFSLKPSTIDEDLIIPQPHKRLRRQTISRKEAFKTYKVFGKHPHIFPDSDLPSPPNIDIVPKALNPRRNLFFPNTSGAFNIRTTNKRRFNWTRKFRSRSLYRIKKILNRKKLSAHKTIKKGFRTLLKI